MQATCILSQQVPNGYTEKPLGILEDRSGPPTPRHVTNARGVVGEYGVSFKAFLVIPKTQQELGTSRLELYFCTFTLS